MSGGLELLGAADLTVADDVTVGDDVAIGGDLSVGGALTFANLHVTGNADIDGTLTTTFGATDLNVGQLLVMGLSTSVISGGELTPNIDPTKIDISAMTGYIVDYNSSAPLSATNPLITFVSAPARIGITPTFPVTWFMADSAGALVQQSTTPTPTQRRTHLPYGLTAAATAGGVILVDQTLPVIPSQLGNQLVDLMDKLGPFGDTTSNLLSANGVNLTFNKTAGTMFARAFSQVPTYQDPHNSVLAAQTPVQFRTITTNPAFFGPLTSILDVANYDQNGSGVITAVGGGTNNSTNFRVWGFANNTATEQILVQYGQRVYASLTAATQGIGSGTFVPNPNTVGGALLGWISVRHTATDLSNSAQAVFTKASKFATP